jgi:hypothetical protein
MHQTPLTFLAPACLLACAVLAPRLAAQAGGLPADQTQAQAQVILAKMTLEEKVGQLNQLSTGALTGKNGRLSF